MASTPNPPRPAGSRGIDYWTTQWVDDAGKRRSKTFGRVDQVTQAKATARFRHWLAEWYGSAQGRRQDPGTGDVAATVDRFLDWAAERYQRDGQPTGEYDNLLYGLAPWKDLHGDMMPDQVTAEQVENFQRYLIRMGNSRSVVNKRSQMLRRWARFCVRRNLAKPQLVTLIESVDPVKRGQWNVEEPEPVTPVDLATVEATTAHLPKTVSAMVWLQWHTGMRPGEVCQMRARDIVTTTRPWLYEPRRHKTEGHDIRRIIPLGPEARRIVKPFLSRDLERYLFEPAEAVEQRRGKASKGAAGHAFRPHYTTRSYRRAIAYGAVAAGLEPWGPNRLRHAALTRIAAALSDEDARTIAGHRDVRTTQIYLRMLQRDHMQAARVAEKVG